MLSRTYGKPEFPCCLNSSISSFGYCMSKADTSFSMIYCFFNISHNICVELSDMN